MVFLNKFAFQISVKKREEKNKLQICQGIISILGKMNSFPLRLESILVFLIYQMEDTTRKIGRKMHGKKLMINWELKKVLPYAMKRYHLILCYVYSIKNKNTKSLLLLTSYSIFLLSFYNFIFVF